MVEWLLLLLIFLACATASLFLCGLGKVFFPKFRSGEHKPGTHRPDLPAGGREIRTYELPLVGGPAITLAIVSAGLGAGYFFSFKPEQWTLLLIGLAATSGYALVGFIDDWRKVYKNEGLSELFKGGGVFFVSTVAAALYFFLLPRYGQEAYGFWADLPLLHTLVCTKIVPTGCPVSLHTGPVAYYTWLVFFMLMAGGIASLTSLSVDFSDGLDGLAGGLVFSASLAIAIVVIGLFNTPEGKVLEVLALLSAASTLGFLPWNWPSGWAVRHGSGKRRARIYMGDSGALGLGGLMAVIAIFSRNELLLLGIGGAFVLEGLSVVIQAKVLTPFFRRNLQVLRFASSREFVPHTDFPLPFLATPLHHHFDLLGWDRRRLVYGAWALGACFAILGILSNMVGVGWQRYIIRILIMLLMGAVWSSGSWSKCYFVGEHPAERPRRRRLALYYGYPYRLMNIRLYHLVEIIEASEDVVETPAEDIALWQRMTIFDARSMLGLYCYRAGYYPAALAQWTRIPERNRILRPEIARLLAEVDNRLALEKQETQPMRRDQIMHQPPIVSGNLPLADLPNPYEPVRSEETEDGHRTERTPHTSLTDGVDEKERVTSGSLRNDLPANGNGYSSSAPRQKSVMLGSLHPALPPTGAAPPRGAQQSWLSRLLRNPSNK